MTLGAVQVSSEEMRRRVEASRDWYFAEARRLEFQAQELLEDVDKALEQGHKCSRQLMAMSTSS